MPVRLLVKYRSKLYTSPIAALVGAWWLATAFGLSWGLPFLTAVLLGAALAAVGFISLGLKIKAELIGEDNDRAIVLAGRVSLHNPEIKWLRVKYQDLPWPLCRQPWRWPWARVVGVELKVGDPPEDATVLYSGYEKAHSRFMERKCGN